MKVIGFDQALEIVGYAVIESETLELLSYGRENFKDDNDLDSRIFNIKLWMCQLIEDKQGEAFCLEDTFFNKNVETFKSLSKLLGVICNKFHENNYLYLIAKPKEWKSQFKIKGRKREEQKKNAQKYVKELYNIDVSEDEADAILITLYMCYKINKKK